MTRATINQQALPPTASAQQDDEQRQLPSEPVSDIAVASAVAQAVRQVPGVADLSAGRLAPAATYGARQRVTGVVVHHLADDEIVLETHVVLSEAYCAMAPSEEAPGSAGSVSNGPGRLNEIASRIRAVVYEVVKEMPSRILVRADVFIDDLR